LSYDFLTTKKGFKYDFRPNDLRIELFEASVEFVFQETEQFKIVNGMNEFEFTFHEFLGPLEYLICKYEAATEFLTLTGHLNIFSIVDGFQGTKDRFELLSKMFSHQTSKNYIFANDSDRDESVRFVFDLEKETITLQTNSNTEKTLDVYLNISDYNRVILKLFSLTNFGENNQQIKSIVSKLEILTKKRVIYIYETLKLNEEDLDTTSELYQLVKKEVVERHISFYSSLAAVLSKDDPAGTKRSSPFIHDENNKDDRIMDNFPKKKWKSLRNLLSIVSKNKDPLK
jgi:hypothetical protein